MIVEFTLTQLIFQAIASLELDLTEEDINLLLHNSDPEDFKPRKDGIGYPSCPFYKNIVDCLSKWLNSG